MSGGVPVRVSRCVACSESAAAADCAGVSPLNPTQRFLYHTATPERLSLLTSTLFPCCVQGKGGFARTGPSRAQFLLDSVADLRSRLRAAGSDLVVRVGRPEAVLPELAASVGAGAVYCQGEVMAEEEAVEGRVRTALERRGGGAELKRMWGGTLFHLEDLPFRWVAGGAVGVLGWRRARWRCFGA